MNVKKLAGSSAGDAPTRVGPAARSTRAPRGPWSVVCDDSGFTLVELMVAVCVIGVLVAVALPNFIGLRQRANEGTVKSTMHTIQMSVEDFGLLNDGAYPTSASATVPDGRTLAQVCPTGAFPKNPWTQLPTVVLFNADPTVGNKGELAINPADPTHYLVKANGASGSAMPLTLSSGE